MLSRQAVVAVVKVKIEDMKNNFFSTQELFFVRRKNNLPAALQIPACWKPAVSKGDVQRIEAFIPKL